MILILYLVRNSKCHDTSPDKNQDVNFDICNDYWMIWYMNDPYKNERIG